MLVEHADCARVEAVEAADPRGACARSLRHAEPPDGLLRQRYTCLRKLCQTLMRRSPRAPGASSETEPRSRPVRTTAGQTEARALNSPAAPLTAPAAVR